MSPIDPRVPPSWAMDDDDDDDLDAMLAASERRRRVPARRPRRRWPRAGWLLLILVVLIVAGNWNAFTDDTPAPSGSPTPLVAPDRAEPGGPSAIARAPTLPPPSPNAPQPTATIPTGPPTIAPVAATPDPRFGDVVVCLDPGHGGWDRGYLHAASPAAPDLEEATLNLDMALSLREILEARGFTVLMTREDDRAVNEFGGDVNGDGLTFANQTDPVAAKRARALDELQARIDLCNGAGADLLISMHLNGFPDLAVSGYETWYSSARLFIAQNRLIASLMFEELGIHMAEAGYNAKGRQVNDDASARVTTDEAAFDRYVITGPAQPGEIDPSQMPGTIVEALFVSNDADAAFLNWPQGRAAIVDAYAAAITRYALIIFGPAGSD